MTSPDSRNLATYNDPSVVAHYAGQSEVFACEQALFDRWIARGAVILDLGVGGGRTTENLSARASRYVGVDYSAAMVEACRARFPGLEFQQADASDLSAFGSGTFDAAVFSFNGIDYLRTNEARARCLSEISRVLKTSGTFIFSSHNARMLGLWPQLTDAHGLQVPWRIARAAGLSARIAARSLSSKVFYAGEGYILDPVHAMHGGLDTYSSCPATMEPQVRASGMKIVQTLSGHYPQVTSTSFSPWHYYACRKEPV